MFAEIASDDRQGDVERGVDEDLGRVGELAPDVPDRSVSGATQCFADHGHPTIARRMLGDRAGTADRHTLLEPDLVAGGPGLLGRRHAATILRWIGELLVESGNGHACAERAHVRAPGLVGDTDTAVEFRGRIHRHLSTTRADRLPPAPG